MRSSNTLVSFYLIISSFVSLVSTQTTQNIKVLFVNEEGNLVAENAVDAALDYVERNSKLGVKVDIERVIANRNDAQGLLDSLCKTYSDMLDAKKPPNVVLDTTMSVLASKTVKSFILALSLPTISGSFVQPGDLRQWKNIDDQQQQILIQIKPPADVIPDIIRSIILNQNISNAAILFDESFVMDHKYNSLLKNLATRHVIASISPVNPKDQLQNLRELDILNFFILGSINSIKRVLDAADGANFFNRQFAWHAITQDKGEIKCTCKNATVMFAKPILDNIYQNRNDLIRTAYQLNYEPDIATAFYFDLALHTFLTIRDIFTERAWPSNTSYITCDDYNEKNNPERNGLNVLKHFWKERSESPVYGPLKVTSNGLSSMEFTMQLSAVEIREGSSEKSVQLGSWTAGINNSLTLFNPQSMDKYTVDVVYRVAIVLQQPFIFADETAPKKYSGYCIDLINEIASLLKFDYEIYPVADGKFGNIDEKGNWNGMVKELMEARVDIGLGAMSLMAEREYVIDFTVPYYDLVGFSILMIRPKVVTQQFQFLTVLENEVWLCILAAYFFASFLMWVFDRWSPYSYQNNKEKYKDDEEKREFNFKECLWFCLTSLTAQGGGEAPKNLSGRLVVAAWWLFGFVMIASYTANLAVFLTVSRVDTPVNSLEELTKQYKIQYAPLNGSTAITYFERMADIELKFYKIWKDMSLNDSLSDVERAKLAVWEYPGTDKYIKMWQAMKKAGLPNSLEEAVKRVRESRSSSEGFAFLGEASDIKYLTLTNCDLRMVGAEFSRKPYAIAVQQGSPLRDQLDTAILTLLSARRLEMLKEKWWAQNPKAVRCEIQVEEQSDGVSIQNIGGAFIVIFVGIGITCITLAFQYCWYRYRKGSRVIVLQVPNPEVVNRAVKVKADRADLKRKQPYPRSRF